MKTPKLLRSLVQTKKNYLQTVIFFGLVLISANFDLAQTGRCLDAREQKTEFFKSDRSSIFNDCRTRRRPNLTGKENIGGDTCYILNSSDNSFTGLQFGLPDDIPIASAYNR